MTPRFPQSPLHRSQPLDHEIIHLFQHQKYLTADPQSLLCKNQLFKSGIMGDRYPLDEALFLQCVQLTADGGTAELKEGFDIFLIDVSLLRKIQKPNGG